jgi:hypothetical protein
MTLKRTGKLKRGKRIKRGGPLPQMSAKKLAQLGGRMPRSSLDKPGVARTPVPRRSADTGPKRSVRDLVRERSGGMCEWPACPERATDKQHRLGRKQGGRHGVARERINGAEWLIDCCRRHHELVTSASGEQLAEAKRMGWVLLEHQQALHVAVLTRHDEDPIWLLPSGEWLRFEEACA